MSRTLAEISEELHAAAERYEEARLTEEAARRDRSAALNRVNTLQKEFDDVVTKIRKDAPKDTDWTAMRIPVPGGRGV